MKVKIFNYCNTDALEEEINKWLEENKIKINFIKQSESNDCKTISIWYMED